MANMAWRGRGNSGAPVDRRKIRSGDTAELMARVTAAVARRLHARRMVASYEYVTSDHPMVVKVNGWREAISTLMERTCSVIGEDTIPVEWVIGKPGIAFTDGEKIYFATEWFIKEFITCLVDGDVEATKMAWADIKAISYHELAHVLYTPRKTHLPTKRVLAHDEADSVFKVYNILEDLRIESLFVTRYAPAKPFLTGAVIRHALRWGSDEVMGDPRARAMAWVLAWGRGYLPTGIVDATARALDEWLASLPTTLTRADFERVIGEYRRLVFPKDAERGYTLVIKLWEMLNEVGFGDIKSGTGDHSEHGRGRAEPAASTRETSDAMPEPYTPSGSDDESDSDGAGSADPEGEDEGEGAGKSSEEGEVDAPSEPWASGDGLESSGDGEGEESEGDSTEGTSSSGSDGESGGDTASDSDSLGEGGGSVGGDVAGPGDGGYDSEAALRDAVERAVREIDPAIEADIGASIKAARVIISRAEGVAPRVNDTYANKYLPVEPWMRSAATGVSTEVSRVFSEVDETWVRGHATGRLNIRDAMSARGRHFDVFETFEDSTEEATSFEVVLLLDRSDSMNTYGPYSRINNAAKTAWILKKALADLGIPVTIIGYAKMASMISTASTGVDGSTYVMPNTRGTTDPAKALPWALSILRASSAHNKMLISISDGDWMFSSDLVNLLRAIRAEGVLSLFVGIEDRKGEIRPRVIDGLPFGHDDAVSFTSATLRRLPVEVGKRISSLAARYATD